MADNLILGHQTINKSVETTTTTKSVLGRIALLDVGKKMGKLGSPYDCLVPDMIFVTNIVVHTSSSFGVFNRMQSTSVCVIDIRCRSVRVHLMLLSSQSARLHALGHVCLRGSGEEAFKLPSVTALVCIRITIHAYFLIFHSYAKVLKCYFG